MTPDSLVQRYRLPLAALCVIVAVIALLQVPGQLTSSPVQRTEMAAGTALHIEVDKDRVMLPWDCVLAVVTWDAAVIQEVTAASLPLKNGAIQRICYWGASLNVDVAVTLPDNSVQIFPQPIRIALFEPLMLIWLLAALVAGTLALYLAGSQETQSAELPARRRFSLRGFAQGCWLLLNVLFLLAMLTMMLSEGVFPAVLFFIVALLATAGSARRFQERAAALIQRRECFLLPIAWFILTVAVLDNGMKSLPQQERLWSAVQTWSAGVFVWLSLYWLASYFLRRFEMTPLRRKHWLLITGAVLVASIAGLLMIFIRTTDWSHWSYGVPDVGVLIYRSSDQSPDVVYGYAPYAQTFPFGWRDSGSPLQRPVLPMIASQVCMTLDMLVSAYDDGQPGCNAITTVWVAYYVTNIIMILVSMLLVYELIVIYLQSPYAALLGTLLAALAPINIWFVSIASTDYTDMVIAIASLWIFHHLFTARPPAWRYTILAGLVFGIFLLLKMNVIYLIFGILLVLYLRRWHGLLALVVIPLLVFGAYRVLIALFGVRYEIVELTTGWRTLNWIWQELLFYRHPYSIIQTFTDWFGLAANRTLMLFGMLLVFGVFVMLTDERFPRRMLAVTWGVFLSAALFLWVFQYPYVNMLLGLTPFIYGAVGLGLEGIQARIRGRMTDSPGRRLLLAIVLLIPFAHNILYWFGWTLRHYIDYDFHLG